MLAYYLRRRKKRRQQAAQRHARDLLCDPRIKRSLVPYPSKETTRRLATLTGLSLDDLEGSTSVFELNLPLAQLST